MSEFFHAGSGEWNQPENQFSSSDVRKEPSKEDVLNGAGNMTMFGSGRKSSVAAGPQVDEKSSEQQSPSLGGNVGNTFGVHATQPSPAISSHETVDNPKDSLKSSVEAKSTVN